MSVLRNRRLLVVEDDKNQIESLRPILKSTGVDFKIADNIEKAKDFLRNEAFDFLFSDLHIETEAGVEEPDGLVVIREANSLQPNLVVVATSTDPRKEIWDKATAAGAQHFLRKPFSKSDELEIAFSLARERKTFLLAKSPKKTLLANSLSKYMEPYPDGIVLNKLDYMKAHGLTKRSEVSSVIIGETGTGKEEFARLVHKLRVRQQGEIPFVAVNCATISESLAESLLFGHKKGSYTGADQTTTGFVGEADGGILFLDEIHALTINIQRKLLRVLADGSYNRLGETRTYRSHFQLICATTKELEDEAETGGFLLDLLGRIAGLEVRLSPLRERPDDMEALVATYLMRKGTDLSHDIFLSLCRKLRGYYWRANIRQLFKVLDAWLLRCEFEDLPLLPEHLPETKAMFHPHVDFASRHLPGRPASAGKDDPAVELLKRALEGDLPLESTIENLEAAIIKSAMIRHDSVGKAAEGLNLGRSTLDSKRRRYGLTNATSHSSSENS